jgi:hypothetical protein
MTLQCLQKDKENRIIIDFKGKEGRLAITGRCEGDHGLGDGGSAIER